MIVKRIFSVAVLLSALSVGFSSPARAIGAQLASRPVLPPEYIAMIVCGPSPQINVRKEIKSLEGKNTKPLFALNISLVPKISTAGISGIEDKPFGELVKPIEINTDPKYLMPSLSFSSSNFQASLRSYALIISDGDRTRKQFQIRSSAERSIWLILIGAKGFYFQEKIPNVLWGDNYRLDFDRHSYGATAWAGAKLGSFNKNFIAVRFGRGLVRAKGEEFYKSSVLEIPIETALYDQVFDVDHRPFIGYFSSEGKVRFHNLIPSLSIQSNWYKEINNAGGQFGLDEKSFNSTQAAARLEIIPYPKKDVVRMIIERTEYFGSRNELFFENEGSKWQILLKFVLYGGS